MKNDDHITITGQTPNKWLYAVGRASVITDKAKIKELWTEGVRPWFPDGTNDSDVSLLCIKPEKGKKSKGGSVTEGALMKSRNIDLYYCRRVLGSIFSHQQDQLCMGVWKGLRDGHRDAQDIGQGW